LFAGGKGQAMFTGLIEGMGEVQGVRRQGPDAVLVVRPPWEPSELVIGESIAVNGACLTVTGASGGAFTADASAETLARTTIGSLRPGSRVNLERALRLGDRLGGHLVTGHVDCVGRLAGLEQVGESTRLVVEAPAEHLRLIVPKGSVALEGVSLTVNQSGDSGFDLNIIPHTLAATTLHLARQGDSVNIETDLIGKYVARLINRDGSQEGGAGGLTRETLSRLGF
jgi:riboflavin synthase